MHNLIYFSINFISNYRLVSGLMLFGPYNMGRPRLNYFIDNFFYLIDITVFHRKTVETVIIWNFSPPKGIFISMFQCKFLYYCSNCLNFWAFFCKHYCWCTNFWSIFNNYQGFEQSVAMHRGFIRSDHSIRFDVWLVNLCWDMESLNNW